MYSPQTHILVAARADEALTHGQVLYGLIKPTKDMEQVESTAAMVNVIPKKRIYVMEKIEELELFTKELFKRPLVIQPSAHIGRGIAAISCTMFTREERWIVLINQAHPKILSRIRMGVDLAKEKFIRGEPFILELSFNSFLKRVYLDRLTKAPLDPRFTFIDIEDAAIVIRSPGDVVHRSMKWEFKNPPIKFEFEDLLPSEIMRRTVTAATSEWNDPALRVIQPDIIEKYLPGWSFEQIDPLAAAMAELPPIYEDREEGGAVGGEDLPPSYTDLDEVRGQVSQQPQGRIMGRAARKAASQGAKYSVPVELHVPEPDGPQVLHTGNRSPSTPSQRSRSPGDPYLPSPDRGGYSPGYSRETYEDRNRLSPGYSGGGYDDRDMHVRNHGPRPLPRSPHSPYEGQNVERQMEQLSMTTKSQRSPRTPSAPDDNYRQYPISPVVKEINQPSRSTYLTDDNDDGGFSPSSRSRTPQRFDANHNVRNASQTDQVSPLPKQDKFNRDRDYERPSPRGQGQPKGRPVAPPRSFHRHQGSGRSESGSDSGFGESDNHIHVPTKVPYYNHAYEKDSPEKEQSMDDILAKHKALAAKMLQQQNQGQGQSLGHYERQDRQDYGDQSGYNKELQRWRQNINNLEDGVNRPEVEFSRSRSRTASQGQDAVEESFI